MGILSVTFYGPFVYYLDNAKTTIDVFAPRCSGHTAGIFTTDSDRHIRSIRAKGANPYLYILNGAITVPTQTDVHTTITSSDLYLTGEPYPSGGPSFILRLPRPDHIYGMNSDEKVEVVKSPSTQPSYKPKEHPTAVRFFYYNCDLSKLITVMPPWLTSNPWVLKTYQPNGTVQYGDVLIRLAPNQVEDADHEEAKACFEQAAALISKTWWLHYDEANIDGDFVKTGGDCRAPVIFATS